VLYQLNNAVCKVGDFTLSVEDCAIEEGGIYSIVGPNGSGKSSLLNLLSFISSPSRGVMRFRGDAVDYTKSTLLLARRREMGYLMQTPYLFKTSVAGNIGYGLSVRGVSRGEIRSRVKSIMDSMLLSHLADRDAHRLSAGEAQRVALARTLILETNVVLLDEPTVGVDIANVHAIEKTVLAMCRERKATVILTTHSMDQAHRMSRNVMSIIKGRVHGVVYENVFEGSVIRRSDGLHEVCVGDGIAFIIADGVDEARATIAISAESIILSNERLDSSALNIFRGAVTRVEATACGLRIFVDIGVILSIALTSISFESMQISVGKLVWLSFKASAVRAL